MSQLILALHILVAIAMIVLILLQHGKGADAGAAFGTGASNTMFGSAGAVPFLMKMTALLAAVFFATSMILSYLSTHRANNANLLLDMSMPASSSTSIQAPSQAPVAPEVQPNHTHNTTIAQPASPASTDHGLQQPVQETDSKKK